MADQLFKRINMLERAQGKANMIENYETLTDTQISIKRIDILFTALMNDKIQELLDVNAVDESIRRVISEHA